MTLVTEAARAPLPVPAPAKPARRESSWFASYPPGVPRTIDANAYPSLHAMLLEACRGFAERPAFECLRARMSYAEWEQYSQSFAAFLVEQAGCRPGDRVAIMLPNLLSYPVAFLGVLRAGMIAVNVNPLYTPRELKEQLVDSGASVIVILENFAHKLETVIADTQVRHVVVARLGDFAALFKRWAFNLANSYIKHAVPTWHFDKFTMLQDACNHVPGAQYVDAVPEPDAVALLQYTGGTTGVSKGAMLTHRNLIANTLQCSAWIGAGVEAQGERALTPLPLYHIFSLTANLLVFAHFGGMNVLIPDPRDLHRLIRTMRDGRITATSGVNTLFNALVNRPEFAGLDFSSLRVTIGGGAAVQTEVSRRWREITGKDVVEGYGLTEASPVVCINPVERPKLGTVGLPVPSTEVTVRDEMGLILGAGEEGEVWVRGPQVMRGYWKRPEESRRVLTPDGWLRTGDIGMFDAEGFLRLLDRKKDLVIVSGFKVFPNEVEDIAMQNPGVLEAAVIGIPDARTGEAVKLFVVKRDATLTAADVTDFLQTRLVNYKRPHIVEFRDRLPKSNIGKILRKELR